MWMQRATIHAGVRGRDYLCGFVDAFAFADTRSLNASTSATVSTNDPRNTKKIRRFVEHEQCDTAAQAVSATIKLGQLPGVLKVLEQDWTHSATSAECFVDVHARLLVHLHPCFLGDKLQTGLRRAACEMLLRFSNTLNCVPLTYDDLRPLGPHGAIVGEHPWVHFLADFRCVGLAPKVGQMLSARVAPLQSKHGISYLILHMFHGFVHKKRLPRGVVFDAQRGVWASRYGLQITEESVTLFQVCSVERSGHDLSVTGEIATGKPATSVERATTNEEATAPKKRRRKDSCEATVQGAHVQVPVKPEETEETVKKKRKPAKPTK